MAHIDIAVTLVKQCSLLSLINTHINALKYRKNKNEGLSKELNDGLPALRVICFLKASLYIVMPHISFSFAIGSKEVREDPYDVVKKIFCDFPLW